WPSATASSSDTTGVSRCSRRWAGAQPSQSHCRSTARQRPWRARVRQPPEEQRGENVAEQGKLLIVDDELSVRDSLGKWFREEGYDVGTAENASDALTHLAEHRWDAALVDIKMRGTDGIELQRRIHEIDSELIVIMMTGYASVETAVTALKNGAYDYVTKPLDPDEISHLVKKALAHKRTEQENIRLKETVAEVARPEDIIGQSSAMQKVFDAIETVGPTDATVRSEEHTSELQSRENLVCRLLLEKKKSKK